MHTTRAVEINAINCLASNRFCVVFTLPLIYEINVRVSRSEFSFRGATQNGMQTFSCPQYNTLEVFPRNVVCDAAVTIVAAVCRFVCLRRAVCVTRYETRETCERAHITLIRRSLIK